MVFITRLLIKLSCLVVCLGVMTHAQAEGIRALRSDAKLGLQGDLSVNSRFKTTLPPTLQDALKQGVSLNFQLQYRLVAPKILAYNLKYNPLYDNVKPITYRLSYHPLTDKYRVNVGTFSTEYAQIDTALRSIGAIVNWPVHPKSTFTFSELNQIQAHVRLYLSSNQLPKPFQVNTLTSTQWDLDSGWVRLRLATE